MKRIALTLMLAAIVAGTSGCIVTDLERAHFEVRKQAYEINHVFAKRAVAFTNLAGDMAIAKHGLQRTIIDRDDDDFWDRHTSDEGRLVSRVDGELKPMLRSQVEQFIRDREVSLLKLASSERTWKGVATEWRSDVIAFDATNKMLAKDDADIQELRESLQARAEQLMNVSMGLLGALGVFTP